MDAHAKPPTKIRDVYKEYQKLKPAALDGYADLIQFDTTTSSPLVEPAPFQQLPDELQQIFEDFLQGGSSPNIPLPLAEAPTVYQVPSVPGLLIYPSLLPPDVQLSLLCRLLHRDLSNSQHQTNLHLHYDVPYPQDAQSYFSPAASDLIFTPKDPSIHKPLTVHQFLEKKLRWTTLGGQYDWTNKVYPSGQPPAFPQDIKDLVEGVFPMKAEAAIVNLYSPGDTLSLHRDVSEECDRPLVSISLGCEAIFICGLDGNDDGDDPRVAVVRLRSGDAVLMSGESRFAWHGVPKVLAGTCPDWMSSWPGEEYQRWRGWMEGKRINLNVRQMYE